METPQSEQLNPWIHIWTQPRRVIRSLIDKTPTKYIIWLALVGGAFSAFSSLRVLWQQHPDRPEYQTTPTITIALLIGAIAGLIHLYLGGWLYRLTGSWIGGKGRFTDCKCAVGWTNYPYIITGLVSALSLSLPPHPIVQMIFGLAVMALVVWSFIIFLKLIGEAHRISAWRALGAVFLTLVLVFVALVIIALLVPLLRPLFV